MITYVRAQRCLFSISSSQLFYKNGHIRSTYSSNSQKSFGNHKTEPANMKLPVMKVLLKNLS